MKRACLGVMLLAALSLASRATASAGTYVGLGIGTSPAISEDTERLEADGRSGRVLLGTRFGQVAVEGAIGGYETAIAINGGTTRPFGDTYQASAALKLSLPLGNNFEAFGRAGLHHTWITGDLEGDGVSGNGYLMGLGFEYRLNLIVGQGSIFVDYQYNKAKLEGDRFVFDGHNRMWTMGLTVGL